MKKLLSASSLLFCSCAGLASGAQILTNGGFETGNFSGWTLATQTGSFAGSNFFVVTGTSTPQSGSTTVGAANGSFFAVTDGLGPEAHALIEQFMIPGPSSSVVLSFSLFVNSYSPPVVNPRGLDFTSGGTFQANQFARVDILTAGASAFDTGSGVLHNYYVGADAGSKPHAYTNYSFDVTSLLGAGGTFQIRFAEVDNLNTLNMGVDNVAIDVTPLTASPEPSSVLISASGLIGLALVSSRLRACAVARAPRDAQGQGETSRPGVAFSAGGLLLIGGTFACSPDVVRATAVGYRDTEHDIADHPAVFEDDMPPVAGAGNRPRCRPLDPGITGGREGLSAIPAAGQHHNYPTHDAPQPALVDPLRRPKELSPHPSDQHSASISPTLVHHWGPHICRARTVH